MVVKHVSETFLLFPWSVLADSKDKKISLLLGLINPTFIRSKIKQKHLFLNFIFWKKSSKFVTDLSICADFSDNSTMKFAA